MSESTKSLLTKADLALDDLSGDGGLMPADESDKFIRDILDEPTLLKDVRFVPMKSHTKKVNKIGFASRILRAATSGAGSTISGPTSGDEGDRALTRANRAKPTTSQIELTTEEIIAEVNLPYEVIEDQIQGGTPDGSSFIDLIRSMIAERVAVDLEELLVNGDTDSDDDYLALMDGYVKLAADHVIDNEDAGLNPMFFGNMQKAVPTKFRRRMPSYKWYMHHDRLVDYHLQLAERNTNMGDKLLTGEYELPILGSKARRASEMPTDTVLYTDPKNLLFGVWRNIRMEYDRDIRERAYIIVLTMRVGTQVEETDMIAKGINIGEAVNPL